jgi:flagellar biosynthesis protein FlhA
VAKNRLGKIAIPAAVVSIVCMMVVPLPTWMLDLLIVANMGFAILILLVAMNVRRPLDFAIFPSLLLVATLFRLALNISATRLVLLHGDAGKVIDAFGEFVVGGSVIVGLVIFLILIVIQFVVVTAGAGRVAEVGARFTLDAMPGKQMAIDADLNAGLIDEDTARRRREEISAEADFYGAMDGSSKFVKGDAVAAIIITLINLVGGFIIGVMVMGMSMQESAETYALLSVGDGLVSQIPALLISIATGLIVTRATTDGTMGTDVVHQFSKQRHAMQLGGAVVMLLAIIPGLPKIPFLLVGGMLLIIAARLPKEVPEPTTQEREALALGEAEAIALAPVDPTEQLRNEMRVEPLELEISFDLVELVDAERGGDLLDRVRALRRKLALELGMVIPLVRTRDNLDLPPHTYTIRVHGVEMGRGEAPPGTVLAIAEDLAALPGTPTREPVFGLAAKWVPIELRRQAELGGATVVDRSSVITTHLAEVVRQQAGRLLGRQDVKALVDMVRTTDPAVIDELTPALSLAEIQRVLQLLLDEGVAIRDLVRIFDVLSERARTTKDPEQLVEAARGALGPAISMAHAVDGRLSAITFEPLVEQSLLEALRVGEAGTFLAIDPSQSERIAFEIARRVDDAERVGASVVVLCSAPLRPVIRRLARAATPRLPVLSYSELSSQLQVETMGVISLAQTADV